MSYKHRYRALIRLATQRSTLPARLQASETPAKIELLHEAALLVLRRQESFKSVWEKYDRFSFTCGAL